MTEENNMTKGGNDITKKEWEQYKTVQNSGLHNMFSPEAIRESGLDKDVYLTIIKNYTALEDKYGNDDDE